MGNNCETDLKKKSSLNKNQKSLKIMLSVAKKKNLTAA